MRKERYLATALALGLAAGAGGTARAASNPKSILVQIACADDKAPDKKGVVPPTWALPDCATLQTENGIFTGRLEWYSGNTLVYVENGPFAVSGREDHTEGSVWLVLEANHNAANFATVYDGPQSILQQPDLHVKLYDASLIKDNDHDVNDAVLVYDAPYRPQGSALWAKHSEDTPGLQSQINNLSTQVTNINNVTVTNITSTINTAVSNLTTQINNEAAARQADVTNLTNIVNNNFNSLQTQINNTTTNLTNQINTVNNNLSTQITNVSNNLTTLITNEASARAAGDAALQSSVAAETAARVAGDAAQQQYTDTQIATVDAAASAEAAARAAGDAALHTQPPQETADRKAGDASTLASANSYTDASVAAETARATTAEAGLQGQINANAAADNAAVVAETARATGAEGGLQTQISAETARAEGAESTITTNLNQEIADRKAGDASTLASANSYTDAQVSAASAMQSAALAAEATARQAADAAQSSALAAHIAADAADELQDDAELAAETARAMAAESTLTTNLNQEVTNRKAGDASTLASANTYTDNAVAGEASARTTSITNLQNSLTTIINSGNTTTLNSAKAYTDAQIASLGGGTLTNLQLQVTNLTSTLNADIAGEVAARQAGDATTLSTAEAYSDANFVHRTGNVNETVTGVKTFTADVVTNSGFCQGADCRNSWNNQDSNSVNPQPRNCPAGDVAIATGPFSWKCSIICSFGTADCDLNANNGCEIVVATDLNNCGGCSNICSNNNIPVRSCSQGVCNGSCLTGTADCNSNKLADGCETITASDPNNCGTGQAGCGVICSPNHIVTPVCTAGICTGLCTPGWADCNGNKQTDGCEISTNTDPNNCSGCNMICSNNNMATRTCSAAVCDGTCNAGFSDCNGNKQVDGCEINVVNDVNNCGGCGTACSTNNIMRTCSAGSCQTGICLAGFADCNANKQTDGCEVNTTADTNNCGSCGHVCTFANAAPTCVASACALGTCNAGFFNVDGLVANGCECAAPNIPASCAAARNVGTVAKGSQASSTLTLPPGQEAWFAVTYQAGTGISYTPAVLLSGGHFTMDIYQNCGLTPLSCSHEGGNSIGKTGWSTDMSNTAPLPPDPAGGGITGGVPTPFTWTTPAPGDLLYVRVRGDGAQGCSGFTVTFTN